MKLIKGKRKVSTQYHFDPPSFNFANFVLKIFNLNPIGPILNSHQNTNRNVYIVHQGSQCHIGPYKLNVVNSIPKCYKAIFGL